MKREPTQPSSNNTSKKQVTCRQCQPGNQTQTFTQTGRSTDNGRKLIEGVDYTVSLSCGHDPRPFV